MISDDWSASRRLLALGHLKRWRGRSADVLAFGLGLKTLPLDLALMARQPRKGIELLSLSTARQQGTACGARKPQGARILRVLRSGPSAARLQLD